MPSDSTPTLDAALAALRAHAPDLPLESYRAITHGWDSLVLLLDAPPDAPVAAASGTPSRPTVVRFARRPEVAAQYRVEAALLPALAPMLPAAVPHFTHVHLPTDSHGLAFVAYPLLPGDPLSSLPGASDSRLAAQVGAFLDALHRFPPDRALVSGLPAATPQTWRQEYADFYAWVRAELFPMLTAHERAPVAALWESYLDDPSCFAFTPALIHRDLAAEHLLYDPASSALTGVIDWGDAAIGDPALDFTGLLDDLGFPFAEAALAAYTHPLDPTFRRRIAFYRDLHPFHHLRFGLRTGDPHHVTDGLALLRSTLRP